MSRRFRLSTALDVDDLLMECIPYAIKLANEKYKFDPPLSIYEVDHWGKLGTRADVIFEFFKDPNFFETQPVISGAKEFVKKLSKMTEVFISTSISPEFMGIRAKRIMEEFPEIPETNIYMGSRKDKINVDILFDDGMHNVFKSNAAYPILMRRPWNQNATGMLAVNTYDEFLKLVEIISKSYSITSDAFNKPAIVVLVGPSGSGKTELAKTLLTENGEFEKLVCYTTKKPVNDEEACLYHYISKKEFFHMKDNKELFESTMYANEGYGCKKEDVEAILKRGKHVLVTMDICGAMSLKAAFNDVCTIFVKKDRKELLTSIISKNTSTEDKVNRIISVDDEHKNEDICDYIVKIEKNNYEQASREVLEYLHFE